MRAVFPTSEIKIVTTAYAKNQAAEDAIDILFCGTECDENKPMFLAKQQAAGLAKPLVTRGWSDGIYYSFVNSTRRGKTKKGHQRSHAKKRPFVVQLNYEQGTTGTPPDTDCNFANWKTPYTYQEQEVAVPNIYAHEGFVDFAYRIFSTPEDLFKGRGGKGSSRQLMSTICVTAPLKKSKFMAFMHPTCYKRLWHTPDFLLRLLFFDKVKAAAAESNGKLEPPTPLGGCRNPDPTRGRAQVPAEKLERYGFDLHEASFADHAVMLFEDFRFAIVFQVRAIHVVLLCPLSSESYSALCPLSTCPLSTCTRRESQAAYRLFRHR
jgi:hypothetical protein